MRATVFSTTDRIEAQSLVALLRGAGIEAELAGVVDAARVGVGEGALPLRIEVDAEDEAEARELIAAKPEAPTEPDDERPPLSRKRPIIALGVPVVWPGLGHVYAGRPYTGVLIGIGVVLSFIAAAASSQAGAAYAVLLVFDAFFGRRAVLAFNQGKHAGVGRQLLAGFAMVLAAFVLTGTGPAVDAYRRAMERRELARVELKCGEGKVRLTNVGDAPREIVVTSVVSVQIAMMFADDDARTVEARGERVKVLGSGETLELEVDRAKATVATLQLDLEQTRRRALRVEFIVRRDSNDPGLRGALSCAPE